MIDHLVSKIGHIVYAENVYGVFFFMFGFWSNLVWYEKLFGHIVTKKNVSCFLWMKATNLNST
jgi:hypothetical protein